MKVVWCGNFPFLKVYTSEEGLYGLGENVVDHRAILSGQLDYLSKLLIGEDPFQIENYGVRK